jgi:Tol biopolymer transport system component
MTKLRPVITASCLMLSACSSLGGAPPKGSQDAPEAEEAKAMQELGAKAHGLIVWSSSRMGNHDLFTMKTDGSDVKQITQGDTVDWFPRFSADGQTILFSRSRKGWVSERDANSSDKWDIYTVKVDGSQLTKLVEHGSWASWLSPDTIIFVRESAIIKKQLPDGAETVVVDGASAPDLEGAELQQPELSHDGKYIAITLRGGKRETGIWNIEQKSWTKTGLGCQINWMPDTNTIYWVHPTGNGGNQVFKMPVSSGKPTQEYGDDELKFMDLPGRRSHEYFPQLSAYGKWMVWGATQRGHDHDTADYEIYLWEVGTPQESAARLTYHSANDRWPDIFIPGSN